MVSFASAKMSEVMDAPSMVEASKVRIYGSCSVVSVEVCPFVEAASAEVSSFTEEPACSSVVLPEEALLPHPVKNSAPVIKIVNNLYFIKLLSIAKICDEIAKLITSTIIKILVFGKVEVRGGGIYQGIVKIEILNKGLLRFT